MTILLILVVIFVLAHLSLNIYINHIIETYIQNHQTKHLMPLGIDETEFIGLHKKELALKNCYMIYARKTTAYKGVILFTPDQNLSYRFYMPLINFLCRQGYIVTTYQEEHLFYSNSVQDYKKLYDCVTNDEILKTYPLSCLGHGSGALAQLCTPLQCVENCIAFQPNGLELNEILKNLKIKNDRVIEKIIKTILKKYDTNIILKPQASSSTYVIYGDQDQQATLNIENASIKVLNGHGRYPFLNIDSEQHIKSLECLLEFPDTPQFEYNKAIENFETDVLYDLNKDVLDILPYLFTNNQ